MSVCNACPRKCNVQRGEHTYDGGKYGFCRVGTAPAAARAALHFWEEPCISFSGGSGTVFFSGCNLRCIFCQNMEVSRGRTAKEISVKRLREIYDELIFAGADNINLVTPSHYIDAVAQSLAGEKLPVPVVYNSGGYDSEEELRKLEGLVDIYLPDYKYAQSGIAGAFSSAPDYPQVAMSAIKEMYRQTGDYRLDEDGMLLSGVLIRHLCLPGHIDNTLDCIDAVTTAFTGENVLFSLMSQYTPPKIPLKYPELNARLTKDEYDRAVDYMYLSGIENGFVQELSSAAEEYTPPFDYEGI